MSRDKATEEDREGNHQDVMMLEGVGALNLRAKLKMNRGGEHPTATPGNLRKLLSPDPQTTRNSEVEAEAEVGTGPTCASNATSLATSLKNAQIQEMTANKKDSEEVAAEGLKHATIVMARATWLETVRNQNERDLAEIHTSVKEEMKEVSGKTTMVQLGTSTNLLQLTTDGAKVLKQMLKTNLLKAAGATRRAQTTTPEEAGATKTKPQVVGETSLFTTLIQVSFVKI